MKVKIYVDGSQKNAAGEMSVYFVVSNLGKRFMVFSGLTTTEKFSGREFPRSVKNYGMKTTSLAKKLALVEEYILKHEDEDNCKLKEGIAELILGRSKASGTLSEYVRRYGSMQKTEGTRICYEQTARKVERFDAKATLESVNVEWLRRFEAHYLKTMSVNGLAIPLRNIRAVYNWCIDEGFTEKYPFRRFKIKHEKVAVRNISVETLVRLRDYPVEPWQEIYRDMFMLSFYLCGINAVDLLECRKLTRGRFVYHRRKTGKLYDLPVYGEAMAIINKYKGKNRLLCPLDQFSTHACFLQHWNNALKKIGVVEHVEDKLGKHRKIEYHPLVPDITTYTARYTFASIAADLDIPRDTIALCLGHSWSDVTSHYVVYDVRRKVDDAVRRVIDYVNSFNVC